MTHDAGPFEPLETTRLRLRCVEPRDAEGLSALMTPGISALVASWPIPFTSAMAYGRIQDARTAAFAGSALPCVIEGRADRALLGWIGVTRAEGRGSLGYWLGEEHQGRGLMQEAVPVVVAAAFRLLGVDAIEAAAQPGNAASLAVLRGCGMVLTGERTIFAPARNRDELCVVYEIARPRSTRDAPE